jgi:hypothetical protein
MGEVYKYYVHVIYFLSDTFLVFIDGILQSPGIDYIIEWEEAQSAYCGGIFLVFKNPIKETSNLCLVIDGIDFWYKLSSIDQTLVDQSKDTSGYSERMTKWLY